MTQEQTAPVNRAATTPKPYFDEDARLNPLLSIEAMRAVSPFFARLIDHVAWLKDGSKSLWKWAIRSLRRQTLYFIVTVVVVFLLGDGADLFSGQADPLNLIMGIVGAFGLLSLCWFGVSFLSVLLLEYRILTLRINEDAEWELLRISPLSRRGIVVTVYAYWRYCFWNSMMSIFNARIIAAYVLAAASILTLRFVKTFLDLLRMYQYLPYPIDAARQTNTLLLAFGLVVVILLLETRWRLNGVSALATALAFAVKQEYAFPARIGTLLGLIFSEIALIGFSWLLSGAILALIKPYVVEDEASFYSFYFMVNESALHLLFACGIFGSLLYLYFRLMRLICLRVAFRAMLREA